MLLQKLVEYSERTEASKPPALYAESPLRYTIVLGTDGQVHSREPIDHSDASSRSTKRGLTRLLPQVQRAYGIKPLLLADNASYTLGIPKNANQTKRAQDCHATYIELAERCATETEEPDVLAVLKFLRNKPLDQLTLAEDFDAGGIITFRIGERYVIDIPAVQEFWASVNQPDGETMQCLVCGNYRPALERLQSKIKGIPGGQTSGTSIISANRDTFESYGLKASQTAPTCQECSESFTRGINTLLSSESNRFRTSNGAFVFWTRETNEFDFSSMISTPDSENVLALLESVRKGSWSNLDETPFYALSLSAAGSRAVVRDWIDTTVKNAKGNLALWFQRQKIAPRYEGENRYYGLMDLANATVRDRKDLPVTTPRALIRSAFKGDPVPRSILSQAVQRCRAERKVTRQRAALIKLALTSQNPDHQEEKMVGINTDNAEPGYLCGRLLYTLERAQRAAKPDIKATIVDRYYGTASSAPQTVYANLIKNAQNHLSKLERDKGAVRTAIQSEMEEILSKLDTFPKTLNLEEQGLFALGYYHQRAENQRQAKENIAKRQAQKEANGQDEAE